MKLQLPSDVQDFGRSASELMRQRAGVDLARRSHGHDGDVRPEAEAILESIDIDGMDPERSLEETLAAAELCRASGAVLLPYPVVPALCRRPHGRFAVVADLDGTVVADHADLIDLVVALDGRAATVAACTPLAGALSRFAAQVTVEPRIDVVPETRVALWLDLQVAYITGALQTAIDLTVEHIKQRRQFGRELSSFQALRFAVVDASLAQRGVEQLLRYTLWRWHDRPDDALADGLGLRMQAQEAAKRVLAVAHQLHGAMGFAEEHDLPFVTRGIQPALRLPLDFEATTEALLRQVDDRGFETLFGRFTPPAGVVAPGVTTQERS
jgi:hypothetical protein